MMIIAVIWPVDVILTNAYILKDFQRPKRIQKNVKTHWLLQYVHTVGVHRIFVDGQKQINKIK
jgi:hypothetical protein